MSRHLATVLGALAALALPGTLRGQVPYDGCLDRHGRSIEGVVDNQLGWAGTATMREGRPVILWNEKALGTASGPMRLFVYLHECAHHALGHLWKLPSARNEEEADCWAYQLIVDGGMARGRHVDAIEREARQTRGDDIHLGGEERVRSLSRCLRIRTDRAAWRSSLDRLAEASADSFATLRGKAFPGDPVGVYESLEDLPGTFECEVRDAIFACVVYAARHSADVRRRFDRLRGILEDWLPDTWTAVARSADSGARREFHAEDSRSGAGVSLVAGADRIAFRFRPRQY